MDLGFRVEGVGHSQEHHLPVGRAHITSPHDCWRFGMHCLARADSTPHCLLGCSRQKDRANSQGLADLKANEEDSEEQYMDSQTAYDLARREKDESEKGEHYATDKYETYLDTVKLAEENIAKLRMDVEARERVVDSEREMILKLLRMLSTMSQVGPSAQGIAAGGYVANVTESGVEARKDGDAGDKMEEIKHQIAEVKARAVQIGGAELTKASKLTKLMDYKETDEVKAILLAMLKDLEGRSALLQDQLDAAENTLADHKAKLVMYQKDMISLADDADRENHRLLIAHGNAAETEANKVTADEEYKDGVFAHRELESNSLKEMAIIIRIQLKLQDFCSGYFQANNVSTGNANKFFRDSVIDLQDPADSHWCVSAYFVDGYDGSTILNVNDKRPDFAVEADDLTFTGENKPREIWSSGFEGQGGVTGIKGPNLISQDETQELTSSPMALTMAVDRKAASIVEEIKQGVADARASPGAGGFEGVQADAGRRLMPVSRDEEAIKKRDDSKSGLFMSAVGVVKVGEDGQYSLCTESDQGAWLFVDGKHVVGGSGSRCAKTDLKAGFHFVRALYGEGGNSKGIVAGGAGSMFKVTGAKCERGGACAERKQLRTKMSWPPRCGDAVKYTGSIDNFGQDAADA